MLQSSTKSFQKLRNYRCTTINHSLSRLDNVPICISGLNLGSLASSTTISFRYHLQPPYDLSKLHATVHLNMASFITVIHLELPQNSRSDDHRKSYPPVQATHTPVPSPEPRFLFNNLSSHKVTKSTRFLLTMLSNANLHPQRLLWLEFPNRSSTGNFLFD